MQFSQRLADQRIVLPLEFEPRASVVKAFGCNLDAASPEKIPDVELKTITSFMPQQSHLK